MERLDELTKVLTDSYTKAAELLKEFNINSLKEFFDVYRQYADATVYDQPKLLHHPYIEASLRLSNDSAWIMLIAATSLVILEQKQRIKELEEKLGDHVTLNIQIQNR